MSGGDIWSSGAFAFETSTLKDLLDSNDYTLKDLLGESELLQELRAMHPQLVNFFSTEESVTGLIRCMLVRPPGEDGSGGSGGGVGGGVVLVSDDDEFCYSDGEVGEDEDETKDGVDVEDDVEEGEDDCDIHDGIHDVDVDVDVDDDDIDEANWNMHGSTSSGSSHTTGPQQEDDDQEEATSGDDSDLDLDKTPCTATQEDLDDIYIRYPYMACEVICCEISSILDILVDGAVSPNHYYDDDNTHTDVNYGPNDHHRKRHNDDDDDDDLHTNIIELEDDSPHRPQGTKSSLHNNPSSPLPKPQSILDLLLSMLVDTPTSQLDDRRAGYLEKILNVLFRKKPFSMTNYINGDHHRRIGEQEEGISISASETTNPGGIGIAERPPTLEDDGGHGGDFNGGGYPPPTSIHTGGGIPLMKALFDHLHSDSVMHIVRGLLMPRHDSSLNHDDDDHRDDNNEDEDEEEEDLDDDGCLMDGTAGLIKCNWTESEVTLELLLDRLLGAKVIRVEHRDEKVLIVKEQRRQQKRQAPQPPDDTSNEGEEEEEDYEARLDSSQHASEILISIIQNSPLTSSIIQMMTRDAVVIRLLQSSCGGGATVTCAATCATTCDTATATTSVCSGERSSEVFVVTTLHTFSRYESMMTTAMSVLETLVLLLGGYGTDSSSTSQSTNNSEKNISTIGDNTVDQQQEQQQHNNNQLTGSSSSADAAAAMTNTDHQAKIQILREEENGESTVFSPSECGNDHITDDLDDRKGDTTPQQQLAIHVNGVPPPTTDISSTAALTKHLPILLSNLSKLLTHPDTDTWNSNVQYSSQPQPLLGLSRLKIVRLLESFVLLGRTDIDHILCQSRCLELCIKMFWKFCWCSMLHQSVANLVVHVMEGGEERVELQHYFLYRCNLLGRLMGSFDGVVVVGDGGGSIVGGKEGVVKEEDVVAGELGDNEEDGTGLNDVAEAEAEAEVEVEVEAEANSLDFDVDNEVINSVEECLTRPRYSNVVLAMKNYRSDSEISSEETEVYSSQEEEIDLVIGDPADEDVIPVSDDDVDAAMEQEVQLNMVQQDDDEEDKDCNCHSIEKEEVNDENNNVQELDHGGNNSNEIVPIVEATDQEKMTTEDEEECDRYPAPLGLNREAKKCPLSTECLWKDSPRKGIMGHTIMLCEALINACNYFDPKFEKEEESKKIVSLKDAVSEIPAVDWDVTEVEDEGDWSRKRKDPPPTSASDDEEDATRRKPPMDENDNGDSQFVKDLEGANIFTLVQKHPLYVQWNSFIITTVAAEKATQNTQLGGINAQNTESVGTQSPNNSLDNAEIDMDVAASMMAALNPPSGEDIPTEEEIIGGVIRGEGSCNGKGAGFGTIVNMHTNSGEYLYEDPLGGCKSFDKTGTGVNEDFGADPYRMDNSNDSCCTNTMDDDDVPVMDLFAGNFAEFEDAKVVDDSVNDDSAWANFDNFEETFAAVNDDSANSGSFPSSKLKDDAVEDLFATANAADIIDASTDLFGTAESLTSDDLFGTNSLENRIKGNTSGIMTKQMKAAKVLEK